MIIWACFFLFFSVSVAVRHNSEAEEFVNVYYSFAYLFIHTLPCRNLYSATYIYCLAGNTTVGYHAPILSAVPAFSPLPRPQFFVFILRYVGDSNFMSGVLFFSQKLLKSSRTLTRYDIPQRIRYHGESFNEVSARVCPGDFLFLNVQNVGKISNTIYNNRRLGICIREDIVQNNKKSIRQKIHHRLNMYT